MTTADADAAPGDAAGVSVVLAPAAPTTAEGSVRRVDRRDDVPLTGYRVDARPGDWMLENAGQVAVIDAHGGRVVDFGTRGQDDALVGLDPTIYVGLDDVRAEVVSVGPAPDAPNVIRIERRAHDVPIRLWTFVAFVGPALRIESVAASEGAGAGAVTIGERVGWGNVPTWVQGTGFVTGEGTFSGDFIAREGLGQAYALGLAGGRLTARFNAPTAGFHERAHTGEETTLVGGTPSGTPSDTTSGTPAGTSGVPRRVLWLAHAAGAIGDAAQALLSAEGTPTTAATLPGFDAERAVAEVSGCPLEGTQDGPPFAHFALAATPRAALLPAGCFRLRVTAPGYAPGAWIGAGDQGAGPLDAGVEAWRPRAGTLRWHVTGPDGATLPARIVVHGVTPTVDPDWGDDPFRGAALDAIATLGDGAVPIPPGRYRAIVSRGFEYTTQERAFDVEAGKTAVVDASLARVVDTRGWISADLHVHAVPSPDAPTLLDDRVRSLAASGVEVAAATDHNAITDYGPTIRALGAQRWLASIVGDEVTTRGVELGHFNVFPLAPADAALPFDRTTPRDIFAAARAAAPRDRDKVVQVNHPRMGSIGYFELIHLDPTDFAGWRRRAPLFADGFDALEVFNGDDYSDIPRVEACMRDWYALLDAGLRVTATGNSDSHKMTYHEPGVPRNFVRAGNGDHDDPATFDEATFIAAVRGGRVVVSSGPFIHLTAGPAEVGDTIDAGKAIDVRVQVQAPPWVDVDTVQLVRRGQVIATWHPKTTASVVRLDETAHLALAAGDWVLAIARGTRPMAYLHRPGALPFSFTNPIFVR
ncbi:MAG TPA: CehA/McbA family metallohydrolase [Polyangiaceae bacterium]|nr:CehA/McbA family metallohydrolase [Polyangiaceae bacterium]